ncbi:histidine phosphatase super family protein [Mycobacterium kansasii]|uniref:Histidine phosphatase super family protein n=1 Tax=Mycobacterium kansasii TaxID=1768 RepID=A0A1V3XTB8_MYCKA|nr:histidine phosphatase super family protein [Mycobacterium kansasii]
MGIHEHRLLLVRHGDTEWSNSGQHTGRTDIELTEAGRMQAELAGKALGELDLDNPLVISSPRKRALTTAELAGLTVDEISPLIAEWDYGAYEGLTTAQIREVEPDWLVWTHGCPTVKASRRSASALTVPSRWHWNTWRHATSCSSATATFRGR